MVALTVEEATRVREAAAQAGVDAGTWLADVVRRALNADTS